MSDQPKGEATNVAPLPTKGSFKKLAQCKTLGEAFETKDLRDRIAAAAPKHLDADILLRSFVQACGRTPLIYKCDFRQALGALMSLTFLGLRPGTVLGHAHLIPFAKTKWNSKTKQREPDGYDLQVIIGYEGYEALAYQSGFVRDLQTGIYLPGDDWREVSGTHKELFHSRNLEIDGSRLTPKAVYAVARMANEGAVYEVMSWPEVLGIRNRSQAYRTAERAKATAEEKGWRIPATWTEAPWVRDERQMGRKTVIRRIAHYLPMCPELRAGVALEDAQDSGKSLDFGPVIDGTATPFDGIPEVTDTGEDGGGGGPDPGAAFGDRRDDPDDPGPDDRGGGGSNRPPGNQTAGTAGKPAGQTGKPPADRQPGSASTAAASGQTAAHTESNPPPFEAVLIDAYGEPADGEIHTDPVAFARSLAELHDATIEDERGTLLEHNADMIADARAYPAALVILDAIGTEAGQTGEASGSTPAPVPIVPADVRGKPDWKGWVAAIRTALAGQTAESFPAWLDVQRKTLSASAPAHRPLAARAIVETAGRLNAHLPPWFSEAIRPTPAKPPAADPAGEPALTQAQKDDRWGAAQMGELRRIGAIEPPAAALAAFEAMAKSSAVQSVMRRLAGDPVTKPLFDRIDGVFLEVRETIDRRIAAEPGGGAAEDDPGPPGDDDYGRGDRE